jgi:hypothetical protein
VPRLFLFELVRLLLLLWTVMLSSAIEKISTHINPAGKKKPQTNWLAAK